MSLIKLIAACGTALLLAACAGTHYQPQLLSGQLSYQEKISLPVASTMVHLRLYNVAGNDGGPANLLAEQFINSPQHFPVTYSLRYDLGALAANGSYELDSQVYADGQLRMTGAQSLELTGGRLPDTLNVTVKPIK